MDNAACFKGDGMRYLKLNDRNWRKLCNKQIKYEQQEIKLDDKKQIEFKIGKKEK